MPSTKNKAYIALCITSIVWGTTWVAMKYAVKGIPPFQLAAIRHITSGSIFVLFFLLFKKEQLPTWQQFKKLLLLGTLSFVMANALSTWSLKYISSGLGALIGALYPLSVVLIEYFFYHNKNINRITIIGIALGIGGIVMVFYNNAFSTKLDHYLLGLSLSVIAMLSWSCSSVLIAKKYIKMNSYYSMGWQMLISFVVCFLLSLGFEKPVMLSSIPAQSVVALIYLIIAGSLIAMMAFMYTMKHLNPAIAVMYAYINPIVAMVTGSIMLHEHLSTIIIFGSIITLTGVFLVNKSFKKNTEKDILNAPVES